VNNQSVNHFPKAASISLALLFILIAVLAGYGETHATPVEDPAPPSQPNETVELVWVRQDPPIINVNNDPTYWEATEPRFEGSYTQYTITDTEIAMDTRYVDHGWEGYHVTIKTNFDRPPRVLNPELSHKVTATSSHSGTHNEGSGSVGSQFWYSSPYGAVIEPNEVLGYYPFDAWWDGTSYKEWMINPPAILGEGDTFEMYASWWNCPPCNITWTYKAEPANAVTRLAAEVVQPTVIYQGKEVPPGEIYFPEPCPTLTTHVDNTCENKQKMEDVAMVDMGCYEGAMKSVLVRVSLIDLSNNPKFDYYLKALVIQLAHDRMIQKCRVNLGSGSSALELNQTGGYEVGLVLEDGVMHITNVIGDLTTSVDTPLGAAYTASQGTFMAGYSSSHNSALFRAYSTPLLLEPKSGSTLVIKPNQEVELTSEGFGPVSELPHLYLPMVTR
jgi:hypothetical protein